MPADPYPRLSIPVTNNGQPKKTLGLLVFPPKQNLKSREVCFAIKQKRNFVCKLNDIFISCKLLQSFLGLITFKQAVP